MMSADDWGVIGFTLWVAALSVLLILPPGVALAWLLARRQWPGKTLVETLVSLPLVLPPVATGLILLMLLGRNGPLGGWLHSLGIDIVFTWRAVVVALGVMAFPLLVRSMRTAFEGVPARLEYVASTLGAGRWRIFWTLTLPLSARGVVAGMVLAFARALGEFGATVMVAGYIPGKTSTLSVEIYHAVQLGKDHRAMVFLLVSALIAFAAVWFSESLTRKRNAA